VRILFVATLASVSCTGADHPFQKAVCDGATARCFTRVQTDVHGHILNFTLPMGFGPADLASAYNVNTNPNPGLMLAVVEAYGYPNAESDLAMYRSTFGLSPCTVASGCLTISNATGAGPPPKNDDWTIETAADLAMASAACPNCKLLVLEVSDDSTLDPLLAGVDAAVSGGASVISLSWGGPDPGLDAVADEVHLNHPGVGIFVASGDKGYDDNDQGPDIPATSAHVTAVGATSLVKAAGTPRGWTESVWNDSSGVGGSSCSTSISMPSWQASVNTGCSFRADCDVAADGDVMTGVAVYNNGPANSGWIVAGGTSVSSPYVAGVFAVTGNAAAGPAFSYAHPADFYDVTAGNNGNCGAPLCTAGPGWDGPTGNGTPNGHAMAVTACAGCLNLAGCQPGNTAGACGVKGASCAACPTGESCVSGACVCLGCFASGACEAGTSTSACGTAGKPCSICLVGEVCMQGVCACPAGQALCGGMCTNTGTDNGNCGACGHVCLTGQTCNSGMCQAPSLQGGFCGCDAAGGAIEISGCAAGLLWLLRRRRAEAAIEHAT
jgi:hypothetical protein